MVQTALDGTPTPSIMCSGRDLRSDIAPLLQIHIFLTVPLTVAVVVLGCVAAQLGPKEPAFDRHKVTIIY